VWVAVAARRLLRADSTPHNAGLAPAPPSPGRRSPHAAARPPALAHDAQTSKEVGAASTVRRRSRGDSQLGYCECLWVILDHCVSLPARLVATTPTPALAHLPPGLTSIHAAAPPALRTGVPCSSSTTTTTRPTVSRLPTTSNADHTHSRSPTPRVLADQTWTAPGLGKAASLVFRIRFDHPGQEVYDILSAAPPHTPLPHHNRTDTYPQPLTVCCAQRPGTLLLLGVLLLLPVDCCAPTARHTTQG
jgi:hypothetical protein